jgi:enterochelin esterase family protein
VPQVMENLIHKREMPVTIGIFITPGNLSATYPDTLGMSNPDHRAQEYDALNDNYARFLIDEMLPEVAKHYRGVRLRECQRGQAALARATL